MPQLFEKTEEGLDLLALVRKVQKALGHVTMFLKYLVHMETFPNHLRQKTNAYLCIG